MSDYIKREDAKDAVINVVGWESIARYVDEMSKHFCTKDNYYYDALMDAEDAIDDLPSADVAPVRHGHWDVREPTPMHDIKGNLSWGNWYVCTGCGFATTAIEGHITQYKYCPSCGARMDGEDDEID